VEGERGRAACSPFFRHGLQRGRRQRARGRVDVQADEGVQFGVGGRQGGRVAAWVFCFFGLREWGEVRDGKTRTWMEGRLEETNKKKRTRAQRAV
jgi:hypothetical protein